MGYLRIHPYVREEYIEYFNNGHGPGDARQVHEDKILLEGDGEIKLSNGSLNPNIRTVHYLHNQWLLSKYGLAWSSKEPLDKRKEKVEPCNAEGSKN